MRAKLNSKSRRSILQTSSTCCRELPKLRSSILLHSSRRRSLSMLNIKRKREWKCTEKVCLTIRFRTIIWQIFLLRGIASKTTSLDLPKLMAEGSTDHPHILADMHRVEIRRIWQSKRWTVSWTNSWAKPELEIWLKSTTWRNCVSKIIGATLQTKTKKESTEN